MSLFFYLSFILLAIMLFFPVSKLIWTTSVRRLEKKTARKLGPQELEGQRTRARFIALLLVLTFSWFFNLQLLGPISNG